MRCERCRDNLTELIEGGLAGDAERRQAREHIESCPECARALAEMGALVAVLHDLPEVEPPGDLRARLSTIPERAGRRRAAWWQRSRTVMATVAGAAAAALLMWTGVHFYQSDPVQPTTPMVAERAAPTVDETVHADPGAEEPSGEMGAMEQPDEALADSPAEPAEVAQMASEETAPSASAPSERHRGASTGTDRDAMPSDPSRAGPAPSGAPRVAESTAPAAPIPAPAAIASETEREVRPDASTMTPRTSAPPSDRVAEGPLGPSGPAGPAGPAGPSMRSMVADAPVAETPRGTLTLPGPMYLDAADGVASAPVGEGTPFTVGVTPPHEKVIGTVVPATIRLEAEADVARARVTVAGSDDLDLIGLDDHGVLFEGRLAAGQQTVLSLRMLARRAGSQSITMRVRSTDPVVDTQLDVGMGEFAEPVPPAERPVQFEFVGTPIREAVSEITRQSGMSVIVDPGVGDATVTTRADDAIPAAGALRAIAESAGLVVTEKDGASIVERPGGAR